MPDGAEVIGCVYLYPTEDPDHDATVRAWVRDIAHPRLDAALADAIAALLDRDWPFANVDDEGRI